MTVLVGRTTAVTTADFVGAGHPTGWKVTALASGTLVALGAQFKVANPALTSVEMGIYTDVSGTRPGTKLTGATTTTSITGTAVFGVTGLSQAVVSGTVYWLALRGVGEQVDFQGNASGTYLENPTNTALPATWPSAGNSPGTIDIVIWGEDAGAGGGGAPQQLLGVMGVGS